MQDLSPDGTIFWQWEFLKLNATIVWTWLTMLVLVIVFRLVTRRLAPGPDVPRPQAFLELIVTAIREQIREATQDDPDRYLPFVGTLFLFLSCSTLLAIIPGVRAPAASLSTAVALALCVFVAVPLFGIRGTGLGEFLRHYIRPNVFMFPFHVIGEVSRTVALAVRLFGNVMSGRLIVAILLSVVPLVFPAVMEAFGLLIGLIQAYVFAILALVYVASAARTQRAAVEQLGADGPDGGITAASEGESHAGT